MYLSRFQQLLQSIEPAAQLVEPRVLRRVIRLDRHLQSFRFLVPHRLCYTIERDRLLAFAELGELGDSPTSDLPRRVILLPRPTEEELGEGEEAPHLVDRYLRLLFHACVHLELEDHVFRGIDVEAWSRERREQLGESEFAEIRSVLLKDDWLFQGPDDSEVYIEFAATSLELQYFAPQERRLYFPGIQDWAAVDRILAQDVNAAVIFERFRRVRDAERSARLPQDIDHDDESYAQAKSRARVTLAAFRQLQAKAERVAATGNGIKAILSHVRAARRAPLGYEEEAQTAARTELARFIARLENVLRLSSGEADQWKAALEPLLLPAASGFWTNEARLLYDLQKVCVVHERGIYRLDLVEWIRTLGRRPIRRPLPLMQDALMLRHFRTIRRRVSLARISAEDRGRLSSLLDAVQPRLELRARDRLRGILTSVFDDVGLSPQNIPEEVARRKLVEELLDRIVERSYFNMADLRDTLSKNDLKLPDVTKFSELYYGNRLLQADRRFDTSLDGVYRRGPIYQRWPQALSSLGFGTNVGRMLTTHLFVPFGGAYLILEFFRHVGHMGIPFTEGDHAASSVVPHDAVPTPSLFNIDWGLAAGILLLGTWISLLIQRPAFRAWNLALLGRCWKIGKAVLIDVPSKVLRSQYVQKILASQAFGVLRSYLLEPGLIVAFVWGLGQLFGWGWRASTYREIFLGVALFLNSPVGRYLAELATDFLMRAWHEVKMRVFTAIVQAIMEAFDSLLAALERMMYSVDEWLRFRAGENRLVQAIKLAGGVVWFFISYVVIFVFTLLVEPQVNPIKHFPVVTVSHKLILPTGPILVNQLSGYLGRAAANTLVWTTIWLIPGVFGFLVWELKENWRLYAANRPRRLKSEPIGHHSETMIRLLRPGVHSGTLPRAYAALRRSARKTHITDEHQVHRKWATILHTEEAVRHFVERELINLLEEVDFLSGVTLSVGDVHAATNRIELSLLRNDRPEHPAVLAWDYHTGKLVGMIHQLGWIQDLNDDDLETLMAALSGLMQRSGVEQTEGPLPLRVTPPMSWDAWVALWSEHIRDGRFPETDVADLESSILHEVEHLLREGESEPVPHSRLAE